MSTCLAQQQAGQVYDSSVEPPRISGRLRLVGRRGTAAQAARHGLQLLRFSYVQDCQRLQAVPSHTCCGAEPSNQAPGSA